MERRTFLAGSLGLLAAPPAAGAQPALTPRIGYLGNGTATLGRVSRETEAFDQGLRERGWIEGRSVAIEYRWAEGDPDRLPALVAELVRLKVDVIMLSGSVAIRAARDATSTVPIVFVVLGDPVSAGFVASLGHPGGNMTGLASQYEEITTKQVQLLAEAVPGLSRLVLLRYVSGIPAPAGEVLTATVGAADKLGLKTRVLEVREAAELEGAFRAARDGGAQAVHVLPSPFFNVIRGLLVKLAARYRLPALYEFREYVQDGGLMSYGVSITDMYRRSAGYVDRILKGAKPGNLPIERPTKLELVINLKTAKALGLTIPPAVLARADEVIE